MQRLRTRAQFQLVLSGSTVARTPHFALHRCGLDHPSASALGLGAAVPDLWIGALLPKRWARRAVTRNAIRRQIYTLAHAFEERLPQAGHVIRLRAAFDRKEFCSASSDRLKAALRAELHALFDRSCGARP